VGNLIGVWLTIALYHFSGAAATAAPAAYFAKTAAAKVALSPLAMVLRGILCNICVCLAIWCGVRMKSESGKLIMTIWCILIFMVCGFEHSIANMSIIGIALVNAAGPEVSLLGYLNNLFFVTIGNILGAIFFVTLPYQKMRH
jgi:nitrite transporter NirC